MKRNPKQDLKVAVDLTDPVPDFMLQLDTNREAAMAAFQRFAMQLFQVAPPPVYARVPVDDRDDVFSEVVFHCIKNDCAKLRMFQPRRGASFAGWLAVVAQRKISDILKQEQRKQRTETAFPYGRDFLSRSPTPEERTLAGEREGVFLAALRKLDRRCRLLLRLWYRGYKNREIVQVLRLPRDHNKRVGNQVIECREKLKRLLRESGYFETGRPEAG